MESYVRTIRNGHEHVLQALPRLLTIWLSTSALPDLAAVAPPPASSSSASKNHLGKVLAHMSGRIAQAKQDVPASTWYLALPQLVSRISHPYRDTSKLISDIVTKVMWSHPHQVNAVHLPFLLASFIYVVSPMSCAVESEIYTC
jgi:serine/threonine-protein kinase ATR